MNVKVTALRDKGVPVEEKNHAPAEGVLIYEERAALGYVAALVATEDRSFANLLQPMIRVFLAGVGPYGFTLSGLCGEDGAAKSMGALYLQQWRVEPLPVQKKAKGKSPLPEPVIEAEEEV